MTESRTLRLQQAMASLVLDWDEASLEADPSLPARRQALSVADQQAFRDQGSALLTYRELARMSLIEPLEEMFPVLKALLDQEGLWDVCVQAFLQARTIRSGQYRDIAPSFLGWMASTHWGQDRWPFLLELAHAEMLEVLVSRFPDSAPAEGLHAEPDLNDSIVLDPATQVVAYSHAVHRVQEQAPVPEAVETHLVAYRNHLGRAQLMEITPGTAALLVRAQQEPLIQAAQALNLGDLTPALNLLRNLHQDGAIAGFRSAT